MHSLKHSAGQAVVGNQLLLCKQVFAVLEDSNQFFFFDSIRNIKETEKSDLAPDELAFI